MTIAQLLETISLVTAWTRQDDEAVQLLIKEAGAHLVPNLIELLLMILAQNTEGHPSAYLRFLSEQALAIQANEHA